MKVTCKCGNDFNVRPYRIKNSEERYCSVSCYKKYNPRKMKNSYELSDQGFVLLVDHKNIVLRVLLDADDLERIINLKVTWYARKDYRRDFYYVYSTLYESGKKVNLPLHRFIISASEGMVVDHINGDTLDNRRCNLREVTKSQNAQNRVNMASNNSSGFRGVSYHKRQKQWVASLTLNGKKMHVGYFNTKEEAGEAVMVSRRKHMKFSEADKLRKVKVM